MAGRSLPLKTERLAVLVSPEEKATLHARAEALSISTGEMIRRAALAYRPSDQAAESEIVLEALVDELIAAAKEARQALNSAEKELRATLRTLREV
ncbi:MAG TPA: hypothetical protein VFS50_09160 [Meiothermus sp.]|nr:hypothetical protein [Meiothermus sp.]